MFPGRGPRIGHRSLPALAREVLQVSNWAMLGRLGRIHDRPFRALLDEVLGRGRYPRTLSFETPVGSARVRQFHPNDLSTLHLIFCRGDYVHPDDLRVVVDVGSAIGLASDETVESECVHIMDILEPVLCRHDRIDVLKDDNEGHELRTLRAIEPAAWRRIRVLDVDRCGARGVVPSDFRESRRGSAERFVRA